MQPDSKIQILDADETCPQLDLIESGGVARAVVWPGVGASLRSMHTISLGPGGRTIEMAHPMEAVYYVISGSAAVFDRSDGARAIAEEGAMIFVEPNTRYAIVSDAGAELVGGPCPPDPSLYASLGLT